MTWLRRGTFWPYFSFDPKTSQMIKESSFHQIKKSCLLFSPWNGWQTCWDGSYVWCWSSIPLVQKIWPLQLRIKALLQIQVAEDNLNDPLRCDEAPNLTVTPYCSCYPITSTQLCSTVFSTVFTRVMEMWSTISLQAAKTFFWLTG